MAIVGAPVTQSVPRELAGAMSAIFNGGDGPSAQYIDSSMSAAGIDPGEHTGNKAVRVRTALTTTPPGNAWRFLDELIHQTRDLGFFSPRPLPRHIENLQAAVNSVGGHLTDEGFMSWSSTVGEATETTPTDGFPVEAPRTTLNSPVRPSASSPPARTGLSAPTHPRLLATLRRIPEAIRPFAGTRRSGKPSLPMVDEYDLQDAVQVALRLIYDDVRAEERVPSYAGNSTTQDFLIPAVRTMVEVKVTRPGRANRPIRDEITVDTEAYGEHSGVDRMVFVVYDLAGTMQNPAGMETQMSRAIDGHQRDVLIVRWPTV